MVYKQNAGLPSLRSVQKRNSREVKSDGSGSPGSGRIHVQDTTRGRFVSHTLYQDNIFLYNNKGRAATAWNTSKSDKIQVNSGKMAQTMKLNAVFEYNTFLTTSFGK